MSGELRSMKAVLPAALAASVARHPVIVPHTNAAEAALVRDCEVIAARHILEVCADIGGEGPLRALSSGVAFRSTDSAARFV